MTPYFYEKTKDLTDDNIRAKVQELITEIGDTNFTNANQTDLMFAYHNRLFKDTQEHTKGCGACRLRVYNRLVQYLTNDKAE